MQKNTPELWDSLWEKHKQEDGLGLIREENSIRWHRISKEVVKKFKDFRNLKVIEIGAGSGTNALLFAKYGARITILDYSKNAISKSKKFFKENNCEAEFILADALNLPQKLKGKYDVVMSFGLAEHFKGRERLQIIRSHFDLLNKKGLVLISVPNKSNPPYRIHKLVAETAGTWKFGEEFPFSRGEFLKIGKSLKVNKMRFIGDSFYSSFRFINPLKLLRKKKRRIKKEKGSFLDSYLGYSLVFIAEPQL